MRPMYNVFHVNGVTCKLGTLKLIADLEQVFALALSQAEKRGMEKERELYIHRDTLAILNRDGGHRQAEVGVLKASLEARDAYYALVKGIEESQSNASRYKEALSRIIALARNNTLGLATLNHIGQIASAAIRASANEEKGA